MEGLRKSQIMTADQDSLELLNDIDNERNKKNKFDYLDVNLIINKSDEEEHLYHDDYIENEMFERDDPNFDTNEQQAYDLINDRERSKETLEAIQEAEEEKDEEDVDDKEKCIIKESDESIELIRKDSIENKIISRLSKLDERITTIGRLKEVTEEGKYFRMKNGFLQKKYRECIKKMKKYDVLDKIFETSSLRNSESYEGILEEYMRIKLDVEKKRPTYENEISKMEKVYKSQADDFNRRFKELLSRELEIGNNVVNSKTGKAFGEREARKLIERQKSRALELADTRIIYLKRRNSLNDLTLKLHELDNLGIGYTTMDYEQMSIERQGALEKLEEREEEIRNIREKCFTYVAVLSHIKESIDSVTYDIHNSSAVLSKCSEIQNHGRYVTMKRKLEIDIARKRNIQLRESGGLLAHPDLLSKMETDIKQLQFFKQKTEWLRAEVNLQHRQADMIKAFLKRQRNHFQSSLSSY